MPPKVIAALQGKQAVQISADASHSLVLLEDGEVFSCGHSQTGAHGHGAAETGTRLVPVAIASLLHTRILQVAAGAWRCFARTDAGVVISFGE